MGKSKRPNGWIIGAIASGSLLVGVAITLVVLSAGQTPEQSAEQEAEVLAIKACGIEEDTGEETSASKWSYISEGTGRWSMSDALEELVAKEKLLNERASYSARAERLDNYWASLAKDQKIQYLFVKNVVDLRELHTPGLVFNALTDTQSRGFYDRAGDDLESGNVFNDAIERMIAECGFLYDTLRERE